MDVVGSEIGQKMRSAIKAKLTELGCYVDDELPDYVMVMVANKRTRSQMEDDLQLFLGDNTELFVNWLHQVLKKLQEVSVSVPLKADVEKSKKENKSKEKKDKSKKGDHSKKSKKKEKEKARKKLEKKSHKSKKKAKHHEMIRPNIPPLLMNMEKPEPSITDVFAGQILKNHGVSVETYNEDTTQLDVKIQIDDEVKKPIVPIIDPATIPSQSEATSEESQKEDDTTLIPQDKDDQIKEINEIEVKMHGLKEKLAEQLDSMSDDEDFLNIRTEAEELMNDFAEDVFQEISQPLPATPPICKPSTPIQTLVVQPQKPKETPTEPETLPQIELNLPKRPVRERLGAREVAKVQEKEKVAAKIIESPERVSTLSARTRSTCASVVRVRPRPRVGAPASSLLLRAVADAHKSLLNIPPKVEPDSQTIKRALVLPMRRCVDPKKIVIQVPGDMQSSSRGDTISLGDPDSKSERSSKVASSDIRNKEESGPRFITKVITNTEYVPNRTIQHDDIETINIHNTTVDKSKDTQFIVTMDGYHPNSFLAKKLMTEGILDEDEKERPKEKKETSKEENTKADVTKAKDETPKQDNKDSEEISAQKRLSDTSEDSATQVIINQDKQKYVEKRKSVDVKQTEEQKVEKFVEKRKSVDVKQVEEQKVEEKANSPPVKKRRASPIVFDVDKKVQEEKGKERERSLSASSDSHVVLTTPPNPHKYDTLPSLSQAERKLWCRAFPLCRFGAACAFAHPRCKFASSCTRRACPYSHAPASVSAPAPVPASAPAAASAAVPAVVPASAPLLASHVVPAANYKSISGSVANLCKFYPACVNPACHFYHPKACRYGKACANKLECNFYHNDVPMWKYSI